MYAARTCWAVAGIVISAALLTACGTGAGGAAANATGCAKGAAGTATAVTVAKEAPSTVNTPAGSCWGAITATPIPQVDTGTVPSGVSADFKVAYSATDLYILTHVNKWPLYNAGGTAWYNSDATEFDLQGSNARPAAINSATECHAALVEDGTVRNLSSCKLAVAPTAAVKVNQGTGYDSVLIVPWQALGVSAPAKGQQYAFDIGQDIGNSKGQRVAQIFWAGTPPGATGSQWPFTPTMWGTITLG